MGSGAGVCCGLTPHYQLALHQELYGRPVVVAAWRDVVVCCSTEAAEAGVRPGMSQRQAQQLCPDAELLDPDPAGADRLQELVCAALYDLSPRVEARLEGAAWIELEGVIQPRLALREMRRRLREATGAEPRLGLGPGPFTARVAALQARPGRAIHVTDAASFLAPLAATTLELEPWQLDRLDLLGLRTLGAVAAIGPRRLESQLGRAGRLAAERAAGLEPDRIEAWTPPSCAIASRQFEQPIEEREALLFVGRALCGDLAVELGLRGAGAKRVRVRLGIEDKAAEERGSLVRHPLSSQAELFGLVGAWLRSWQPAAPVTEMAIELPELEPAGRRQLRLWVRGDGSAEEVKAALERLQERHGEEIALRVEAALTGGAIPSQRYRLLPLGAPSGNGGGIPLHAGQAEPFPRHPPRTPRPAPAARAHATLAEPTISRNLGFFPTRAP